MVSHRLDFVWAEFRAIHACLNFWHLGGAPASGAGPPPRLFGGTSQASYEFLSFFLGSLSDPHVSSPRRCERSWAAISSSSVSSCVNVGFW